METIQEGEKEEYVYKKWWTRRKRRTREKVWIMLSWLDLALGFFLIAWDDSICDVDKLLRPDQHEDMLKQNKISLTDLDFAVAQLFW